MVLCGDGRSEGNARDIFNSSYSLHLLIHQFIRVRKDTECPPRMGARETAPEPRGVGVLAVDGRREGYIREFF